MQWHEMFGKDNNPTNADIKDFIKNPLWDELNAHLKNAYGAVPKLSYSGCSAQKGWNIKYQKSGRPLCTLYPMEGFFISLVSIGQKESAGADLLIPLCCDYTKEIYKRSRPSAMGRWLMLEVTGEAILRDVINLIELRVDPGKYTKAEHKEG